MRKILAFDTSGRAASVAVVTENEVLAESTINMRLTHSQTLMPMCDQLLKAAAISLQDIDGFAVSVGPGSFTGLRIGIGAIKGFAFALNKPCFAVSSLKGLAYNLVDFEGIVCAVTDARKEEAYTAIFEVNQQKVARLTDDMAINIQELPEILSKYEKSIYFVGDGAEICYNKLNGQFLHEKKLRLVTPALRMQKASSVGFAAFSQPQIEAKELMPVYLRIPQAQRERLEKLSRV